MIWFGNVDIPNETSHSDLEIVFRFNQRLANDLTFSLPLGCGRTWRSNTLFNPGGVAPVLRFPRFPNVIEKPH